MYGAELSRSHQQPREGRFAEFLLLQEVVHRFRRVTVQVLGEGHEERVAGPAVVVVPEAIHDNRRQEKMRDPERAKATQMNVGSCQKTDGKGTDGCWAG